MLSHVEHSATTENKKYERSYFLIHANSHAHRGGAPGRSSETGGELGGCEDEDARQEAACQVRNGDEQP